MSERWTKEDEELFLREMHKEYRNHIARENQRREERWEDFGEKLRAILALIILAVIIVLAVIYS